MNQHNRRIFNQILMFINDLTCIINLFSQLFYRHYVINIYKNTTGLIINN